MNKNGFSLIELSIVLIIIGLLVAGITGGQSLVNSARSRAVMNELESVKRMLFTFQASNGRFPGDLNNDGYFGYCRGSGCPSISGVSEGVEPKHTTFGGDYSGKTVGVQAGPWVDLYVAGISDFKPTVGDNLANSLWRVGENMDNDEGIQKNTPKVKGLNSTFFNMFERFSNYTTTGYQQNMKNGLYIDVFSYDSEIDPKLMVNIDSKLDDGTWNKGIIRACCGSSSCADAIYTNGTINTSISGKCQEFYYKLTD